VQHHQRLPGHRGVKESKHPARQRPGGSNYFSAGARGTKPGLVCRATGLDVHIRQAGRQAGRQAKSQAMLAPACDDPCAHIAHDESQLAADRWQHTPAVLGVQPGPQVLPAGYRVDSLTGGNLHSAAGDEQAAKQG
jgi:hypothetical protein